MTNYEQSIKNFNTYQKAVPEIINKASSDAKKDSLNAIDTLLLIDSRLDEVADKIGAPLLLFEEEKEWANNQRKPFIKNAMIQIHKQIVYLAQTSMFPKAAIDEYMESLKENGLDVHNGLKREFNENTNFALDFFDDPSNYIGKK